MDMPIIGKLINSPKKEDLGKEKEKGSNWSHFVCMFSCSRFSNGGDYNKFKDICTCKGELLPPIVFRR